MYKSDFLSINSDTNPFLNLKRILIASQVVIVLSSCGTEPNHFYEEVKHPDEAILRGEVGGYIKSRFITELDCRSSAQGTRIGDFIEELTLSIGDSIDVSKMFVRSTSNEDIMLVWFGREMCEKWESHLESRAKILVRQELKVVGPGQSKHYMRLMNVVDTDDSVYDF